MSIEYLKFKMRIWTGVNESVSLGLRRAQHWLQMITVKYELINCGGIVFCEVSSTLSLSSP